MNKTDILSALDEEISRLRQARDLLADASLPMRGVGVAKTSTASASEPVVKRGPGRPKGSGSKAAPAAAKKAVGRPSNKSVSLEAKEGAPKRRTMSEEGKARIAAAQRARWARQHGEVAAKAAPAGKKSAAKKGAVKAAASAKKAPVKAAKTLTKAPVKARGPYKKSGTKVSAKPAAEAAAQPVTPPASE